jgi:hypothetical protein
LLNRLFSMSTIPLRISPSAHAEPVPKQCTTSAKPVHKAIVGAAA